MHVEVYETFAQVVQVAADKIEDLVRRDGELTLGLATGSTPELLYAELTRRVRGGLDLSGLRITSLDEYIGLPADDLHSYHHYIQERVIGPWGIDPTRVRLPDGSRADCHTAAMEFAAELAAHGGVDLQLLGIGANGHIGFNEPGSALDSGTRVVELTDSTRHANARFFDSEDQVPRRAITQGLGTICQAKQIMLLASGPTKAPAVHDLVHGPVTAQLPASVLHRHPHASVLLDQQAAGTLPQS